MKTPCKGCKNLVQTDFSPEKHTVRFDEFGTQIPGHNDKWICFKCTAEVCISCYMTHIEKTHPELYSCKCLTCGTMTSYKDFRDYRWCVKCLPERKSDESLQDR